MPVYLVRQFTVGAGYYETLQQALNHFAEELHPQYTLATMEVQRNVIFETHYTVVFELN